MPHTQPIFIITGVPGAGKSSVAAELMRRFDYGLHIPVDDLRDLVVSGAAHPVPEWTAEAGRQFALARAAAGQIAATYHAAGFAVAVDDVLGPDDAAAILGAGLSQRDVHKILLHPSLGTALSRSAARTTKRFDASVLADTIRRLHQQIRPGDYAAAGWLTIDSGELTVGQTVDQILGHAAAGAPPERPVDARGVLDDEVFSYRATRDKVLIAWRGKQVTVLKGPAAAQFLARIAGLDGKAAQLVMAKATGNFKRGNER